MRTATPSPFQSGWGDNPNDDIDFDSISDIYMATPTDEIVARMPVVTRKNIDVLQKHLTDMERDLEEMTTLHTMTENLLTPETEARLRAENPLEFRHLMGQYDEAKIRYRKFQAEVAKAREIVNALEARYQGEHGHVA